MRTREIRPYQKRLRGAKRYYRRLHGEAASFSFPLGDANWYDMHHVHFDFRGHGRRGVRHRREHLRALFAAFRRVAAQARDSGRPVQVFVSIAPGFWPEQDALYIHTPNPNGTAFPYAFGDVVWHVKPSAVLREFVSHEPWEVGVTVESGSVGTSSAKRHLLRHRGHRHRPPSHLRHEAPGSSRSYAFSSS